MEAGRRCLLKEQKCGEWWATKEDLTLLMRQVITEFLEVSDESNPSEVFDVLLVREAEVFSKERSTTGIKSCAKTGSCIFLKNQYTSD